MASGRPQLGEGFEDDEQERTDPQTMVPPPLRGKNGASGIRARVAPDESEKNPADLLFDADAVFADETVPNHAVHGFDSEEATQEFDTAAIVAAVNDGDPDGVRTEMTTDIDDILAKHRSDPPESVQSDQAGE